MSELIRVPDIGSGEGEVIELFVKVGDRIEAEQSLLTLESDKASMEIPAPKAGVIKALKVKLGDRLKEGDELLELESDGGEASAEAPAEPAAQPAQAPDTAAASAPTASAEPAGTRASSAARITRELRRRISPLRMPGALSGSIDPKELEQTSSARSPVLCAFVVSFGRIS